MASVSIISIGDELLIGQTINTNAAWIGEKLCSEGYQIREVRTISDDRRKIIQALDSCLEHSEAVIITGGLGPTKDDVTKRALASYFISEMVYNEDLMMHIKGLFDRMGIPMPASNKEQATVPDNCTILMNVNGTAPGMLFKRDDQVVVSLPGVPFEMKGLMENEVIPQLKANIKSDVITFKMIQTAGIGESALMEVIADWERNLKYNNIGLAYLPSFYGVKLRLLSIGDDKAKQELEIDNQITALKELIPDFFVSIGELKPEERLGNLLKHKGETLAVAESCTGGFMGHLITSVSGSSAYFKGGVIAYSNEVKSELLGVNPHDINNHGAVSQEVVEQMAIGVKKRFKSDFAIATSGIAGPTGGTENKPVGTIWIAVSGPKRTTSEKFTFGTNREKNIKKSAYKAMEKLISEINESD